MSLRPAERLLKSLGVETPAEIDLEAIAWHLGVLAIKERELDGCEARIVGKGSHAIISVDPRHMYRRRRFSIAHELGHWVHHRGRSSFCRADDLRRNSPVPSEREANGFAADLILPAYLVRPMALRHPRLTVAAVRSIADAFQATVTATAIRIVEMDTSPAMVIMYGTRGRQWFARSRMVSDKWFPMVEPHHESYAHDLLHCSGTEQSSPRKIGADAFFDRREAEMYEVEEQSIRVGEQEVITLIHFRDGDMLEG